MAERGNGGIIGPANVPTATVASGLWTLEEQQDAKGLNSWPGFAIQRSLRFNSADSAYLNRTPASAGNRRTWTWSAWVKLGQLNLNQYGLFSARSSTDSTRFTCGLYNDNTFLVSDINSSNVGVMDFQTTQVFRDPSAWYHFVMAVDTTQATNTNRFKMYVNGVQVTSFVSANYPSQNADTGINAAIEHNIGKYALTGNVVDGYMTEVNFIDGQALTPSSFGITNPDTGVWQPKPYAGTYGTNGFYLNFSDNSNTTATTLGKDYSGNGNNWTPNNFSVSAGAGNDSLVDVPTAWGTDTGVGGSVRGNYATLNPLRLAPNMLMSNGNLYLLNDNTGEHYGSAPSTIGVRTGKWYAEFTAIAVSGTPSYVFGVGRATWDPGVTDAGGWYGRWYYTSEGYAYRSDGKFITSNTLSGSPATYGANDVIGVAIDLDAQTISFYKNGVSQGTPFTSIPLGVDYVFAGGAFTNNTKTNQGAFFANFGQRPFAYTAPSGFKALCSQNLPTPTIGATASTQANRYFDVVLRTSAGTSGSSVTSLNFQPDFVWDKPRSSSGDHYLEDAVRGVGKFLNTNNTSAEGTNTSFITAFTSNGFTIGSADWGAGTTVVDWAWKANGAGVTNTAGSITSTVSANTTSGFSVVKWNGSGNATIGHGLGVAPSMYIVKLLNQTSQWYVYFRTLGAGKYLQLNLTAGEISDTAIWQNTAPTSTVFSIGSGINANNMVAYCFAEVPGFSKFGSYTGNGSTDGPFVYCGFRPAYVMVKCSSDGGTDKHWVVKDKLRAAPYNPQDGNLYPNLANAEDTISTVYIDFLSNGFKIRGAYGGINGSSQTYIFAAFAEAPQKFALAR